MANRPEKSKDEEGMAQCGIKEKLFSIRPSSFLLAFPLSN
jgi:hypothetical protein